MNPMKLKKAKLRSDYTQNVTGKLSQNFTEKLKEFKTWAQVKSPKTFQPALSYALDWLAPELLGTGFRMYEISDLEMKALIPFNKSNLDSQNEIHLGLVSNAATELSKVFIQRQMPDRFFQIVGTELQIVKKQKWNEPLNLNLKTSQSDLDDFFVQLQKMKNSTIELKIEIAQALPLKKSSEKFKKSDVALLKLHIETIDLIA